MADNFRDELYHHGVLGQKWGVENGPPYPLSSNISTGSRLKKVRSAVKGKIETTKQKAKVTVAKKITARQLDNKNIEKAKVEAKVKNLKDSKNRKYSEQKNKMDDKAAKKLAPHLKDKIDLTFIKDDLGKKLRDLDKAPSSIRNSIAKKATQKKIDATKVELAKNKARIENQIDQHNRNLAEVQKKLTDKFNSKSAKYRRTIQQLNLQTADLNRKISSLNNNDVSVANDIFKNFKDAKLSTIRSLL